jgi:hypothetical protein
MYSLLAGVTGVIGARASGRTKVTNQARNCTCVLADDPGNASGMARFPGVKDSFLAATGVAVLGAPTSVMRD